MQREAKRSILTAQGSFSLVFLPLWPHGDQAGCSPGPGMRLTGFLVLIVGLTLSRREKECTDWFCRQKEN